jgi:hypothetical protein
MKTVVTYHRLSLQHTCSSEHYYRTAFNCKYIQQVIFSVSGMSMCNVFPKLRDCYNLCVRDSCCHAAFKAYSKIRSYSWSAHNASLGWRMVSVSETFAERCIFARLLAEMKLIEYSSVFINLAPTIMSEKFLLQSTLNILHNFLCNYNGKNSILRYLKKNHPFRSEKKYSHSKSTGIKIQLLYSLHFEGDSDCTHIPLTNGTDN